MNILLRACKKLIPCSGARREEGSAIVEMAISASLFLAFVFGIIEASWAMYAYNFVNEAAREATRYAIVRGSTEYTTACTTPGWATCQAQAGINGDVTLFVRSLAYPGIDKSKVTVTTTWPGTVGMCPSSGNCNSQGNLVQVVVSYPFSFNLPFIPAASATLKSSSQLVISH